MSLWPSKNCGFLRQRSSWKQLHAPRCGARPSHPRICGPEAQLGPPPAFPISRCVYQLCLALGPAFCWRNGEFHLVIFFPIRSRQVVLCA